MRVWRSASDGLNRIVIGVCIACVLVMLSISFIGFLYMMTTGAALSWTYSLARLFIPWIGLLSITVAFKNGEHVAMAVVLNRLPHRLRHAVAWAIVGLVGLFAILLIWTGWTFFVESTQIFMVSDAFQVSHRWVAASLPITGAVLLVHLVAGLDLIEGPREQAGATEAVARDGDHPQLR